MATLGDVARRAGVSAASVSRVLNHPAKVSPEVRERVMRTMGELGYVRDGAARALASRHSLTIGNVVPTLGIGIFAAGVAALQRRLEEFGYQLLVAASDYDEAKEARQVRALIERGVDGIALVGQRHAPEVYQLLRSRKLPYVNTYQFDAQNPHPCVGFDNRTGTFDLTRYLIDLGHREFGIVTAPPSLNDRIAARLTGILDCLDDRGIVASARHIMEVAAQTIVQSRGATRALLTAHPGLTAIYCTTDTLAIGALCECHVLGLRVPEDVSVAGFSDLEIVSQLDPPLSTVHVPTDQIGTRTADYLIDRISGRTGPARDRGFESPSLRQGVCLTGAFYGLQGQRSGFRREREKSGAGVTAEGEWIRPPAVPGTFVVNTGAMLARYSNDRFRATPHRVINRNDASRYAVPFFLGPNHDSIVDCVPTCVGPDNPPRYEPTTYGAFTQRRLSLNFAHRRAGGNSEYV